MQKRYTLHHGDCLEVLRSMPDNSVDAVVTDPPYGLSFMGKRWDYDVPSVDIWSECLRVLKPGGHLLAFAGTRTQHRMAVRIEDAGFEIRDMIAWVYGSGFPKSMDVSKAIDRAAGVERDILGVKQYDAAKKWHGWGTALKPALEPITVARKPLIGTVAENVLTWGTGGVNVDGCRVGTESTITLRSGSMGKGIYGGDARVGKFQNPPGRWPANLIHDGSEEVVGLFPETKSGKMGPQHNRSTDGSPNGIYGKFDVEHPLSETYGDSGSAARFFYCAKASKRDRDEGCEGMEVKRCSDGRKSGLSSGMPDKALAPSANHHPTVKPTDLMRYLCRLVTPPGGTVLDPFMGSGSTGKGAILEGFDFIGIEREAEYLDIARARIEHVETSTRSVTNVQTTNTYEQMELQWEG